MTSVAPARRRAVSAVSGVDVWLLELGKLAHQQRVRVAAGICLVGPFAFLAGLQAQSAVPADTLFGRWVHTSGFAVPLVALGFTGQWVFPLLTSLVAGDMFAAEDHFGTWKMILTRSGRRGQIFAGKVLAAMTFSVAMTVILAAACILAGVLAGTEPIVGLSGQTVPTGHALALVVASWAVVLPPVVAFTALGLFLSVASRHSAVAIGGPLVVGLVLQLVSLVDLPWAAQVVMPTTAFTSWHGFWTAPTFRGPFFQGTAVSLVWAGAWLAAAAIVFTRRSISVG